MKKKVVIDAINIEEDSSRIIEKSENFSIYSLDRLGIPLIEITTAPDLKTPKQVFNCSKYLGDILKSFKTKKGLGTIRQDINVSVKGGARIEIKGCQNLELIEEISKNEAKRQLRLIEFIKECSKRGFNEKTLFENEKDKFIYDLTNFFKNSKSSIIQKNIQEIKENKFGVFGIKIKNFRDFLGFEINPNIRIATEISNKNKSHFPSIKGLIHRDEIEKYDFEKEILQNLETKMKLKENDNFIIITCDKNVYEKSFLYIKEVILQMIENVNSEVRQSILKTTTTKYLREMPSSSRMYPETDLEIIEVDKKKIDAFEEVEIYSKKIKRLEKKHEVSQNIIEEVLENFDEKQIEELIKVSKFNLKKIYNLFFDMRKDILKRENLKIIDFEFDFLKEIFKVIFEKNLSSSQVRNLLINLTKDKTQKVDLEKYLLDKKIIFEIDKKKIEEKVKQIIEKNKGAPFGAIMGILMSEFKGEIDGKFLSEIIKENL